MPYDWELTPRQEIAYTDRIDVYKPTRQYDANGVYTGATYSLEHADVPCYFEVRQSVEGPGVPGRTEGDNAFTRDSIHCPAKLDIDADWWAVNRTLNGDGTQAKNYGRYWVIVGQPRSLSQRGNRTAQKREVQAIQLQKPPVGVGP